VFARALRAALRAAHARDGELFLWDELLSAGGDRSRLVRVGAPAGKQGKAQAGIASPRWLEALPAGEPRWDAKSHALTFGVRLEGELAGLLRLQLAKAPFPAEVPAIRAAAERLSALLEHDRLGRRLEVAEGHYRTILESAGDGILIVDARTGRVVEANRRAAQLSRYRERDLVGKILWSLLGDEGGGDARRRLGPASEHRPILRLL
ncbi:MAG: PAS domain-containing protein, partial [Deltaproteobacteria bacterium]